MTRAATHPFSMSAWHDVTGINERCNSPLICLDRAPYRQKRLILRYLVYCCQRLVQNAFYDRIKFFSHEKVRNHFLPWLEKVLTPKSGPTSRKLDKRMHELTNIDNDAISLVLS
jgi:hypothetical protein